MKDREQSKRFSLNVSVNYVALLTLHTLIGAASKLIYGRLCFYS